MSARVLLIEDADDISRLVAEILEDEDYSLVVAPDGEAGLAAVESGEEVGQGDSGRRYKRRP